MAVSSTAAGEFGCEEQVQISLWGVFRGDACFGSVRKVWLGPGHQLGIEVHTEGFTYVMIFYRYKCMNLLTGTNYR